MLLTFLVALIEGLGFVILLTTSSVAVLIKTIWTEGERLTRLWLLQVSEKRVRGKWNISDVYATPLYYILLPFAFFTILATLMIMFHYLGIGLARAIGINWLLHW
jgi:hypothetical protein